MAPTGKYDLTVTVEVGETYRYPMAFRDDMIVRITAVRPSKGGQMAHCKILSGGYNTAEDVAKYGEPEPEMDTRSWSLLPL